MQPKTLRTLSNATLESLIAKEVPAEEKVSISEEIRRRENKRFKRGKPTR